IQRENICREIPVPCPQLGHVRGQPQSLLAVAQRPLGTSPVDALCNGCSDSGKTIQYVAGKRTAGKDGNDTDEVVPQQQWMAGKRDQAFPMSPLLVIDGWIRQDVVGQVRLPGQGNFAYLESSNRNTTVRAVEAGIHSRTGVKFEHILGRIQDPDSRKG